MPNLYLIKSYTDPLEALKEIINGDMVDLILLDINMPSITGIDLSREIRKKTRKLIFSTAYKQYGYEAFEVEADAYLLKPYTISKFVGTLARIFPANESKLNYVQIHTLSKKILTYMSLSEISKTLRHLQFFVQFQRSFIIGKRHIESIDGNTIKMVTGLQITVGEYYRKDFSAFLTERLIKAGRKT